MALYTFPSLTPPGDQEEWSPGNGTVPSPDWGHHSLEKAQQEAALTPLVDWEGRGGAATRCFPLIFALEFPL